MQPELDWLNQSSFRTKAEGLIRDQKFATANPSFRLRQGQRSEIRGQRPEDRLFEKPFRIFSQCISVVS